MIIDLILDRKDGCSYQPDRFYRDVMEYSSIFNGLGADICEAMDYGTEDDVRRGVRLAIRYTMHKIPEGELVMTGRSRHCFVDLNGKPIILERNFPDFANKLKELLNTSSR